MLASGQAILFFLHLITIDRERTHPPTPTVKGLLSAPRVPSGSAGKPSSASKNLQERNVDGSCYKILYPPTSRTATDRTVHSQLGRCPSAWRPLATFMGSHLSYACGACGFSDQNGARRKLPVASLPSTPNQLLPSSCSSVRNRSFPYDCRMSLYVAFSYVLHAWR